MPLSEEQLLRRSSSEPRHFIRAVADLLTFLRLTRLAIVEPREMIQANPTSSVAYLNELAPAAKPARTKTAPPATKLLCAGGLMDCLVRLDPEGLMTADPVRRCSDGPQFQALAAPVMQVDQRPADKQNRTGSAERTRRMIPLRFGVHASGGSRELPPTMCEKQHIFKCRARVTASSASFGTTKVCLEADLRRRR